jgi:hypothetical protein
MSDENKTKINNELLKEILVEETSICEEAIREVLFE